MAQSNDQQWLKLFGTDTLPTPYTSLTPESVVIERLEELHPEATIYKKQNWLH